MEPITPVIDPTPSLLSVPGGPFGTIISDPPWNFTDTNTRAAAEDHYATMSIGDVLALPVEQVAAAQSHLWLWTTAAHMEHALSILRMWGFTYKLLVIWVKTKDILTVVDVVDGQPKVRHVIQGAEGGFQVKLQIGMGHYLRHAHEVCLFAARGKLDVSHHGLPSVIFAPRTQHSCKPPIIYEFAELMSPALRLEMFAREGRDGWAAWGQEAPDPPGVALTLPPGAL